MSVLICEYANKHLGNTLSLFPAALKSINFLHDIKLLGNVVNLLYAMFKSDKNAHLPKVSGNSDNWLNDKFRILRCGQFIGGSSIKQLNGIDI